MRFFEEENRVKCVNFSALREISRAYQHTFLSLFLPFFLKTLRVYIYIKLSFEIECHPASFVDDPMSARSNRWHLSSRRLSSPYVSSLFRSPLPPSSPSSFGLSYVFFVLLPTVTRICRFIITSLCLRIQLHIFVFVNTRFDFFWQKKISKRCTDAIIAHSLPFLRHLKLMDKTKIFTWNNLIIIAIYF